MIVYIQCFIASVFLFAVASRVKKRQRIYIMALAIIIPCVLAAVRDDIVGTDTTVYLRPIYNAAEQATGFENYLNTSWFHIYKYNKVGDYDFGFVFVVYAVTKMFHSISLVKFAIEFLVLCPICVALDKYCDRCPVWMGMGVFYLLFYNQSFNLMRQYIAVAFLFLGIMGYLRKNSVKHYVLFEIIALLFHGSAIIGIAIFVVARYIMESRKYDNAEMRIYEKYEYKDNKLKVIFLSMIGVTALLTFGILSEFFTMLGFGRYMAYVVGDLSFMPNQVLIRLPILLMCIWGWENLMQKYSNTAFLITMIIYTIVFSHFAGVSTFGARIAVYFAVFQVVLIPEIICSKLLRIKVNICAFLLFVYLIFYWYYFFCVLGMDETVPFIITQ